MQLAVELAHELVLELVKSGLQRCFSHSGCWKTNETVDSKFKLIIRCASAVDELLTFYHLFVDKEKLPDELHMRRGRHL